MDTIEIGIKNIALPCIIGCLEEERKGEQTLFVDVAIENRIVSEDALEETIDYCAMFALLQKVAEGQFFLIETLAQEFAKKLLKSFPTILSAKVTVKKMQAMKEAAYTYVHYEVRRGKKE